MMSFMMDCLLFMLFYSCVQRYSGHHNGHVHEGPQWTHGAQGAGPTLYVPLNRLKLSVAAGEVKLYDPVNLPL